MNTIDAIDRQAVQEKSSCASSSEFRPLTPKYTEIVTYQYPVQQKPVPLKKMMREAIKTLSSDRRSFSLAGIKKFILHNYLHTESELMKRMVFIKKFFRDSLQSGQLLKVKGIGLNGSFRTPSKSQRKRNRRAKKQRAKKVNKVKNESRLQVASALKPRLQIMHILK